MTLPALSLRSKLFLFAALLVLIPGVLLSWLADRSARDSLQRVIGRQLAREALHTADRLSALLQREEATLVSFARQDLMREIRVGDIDKRVSRALVTLREGNAARLDYVVVDSQGRVVAASGPAWLEAGGAREASRLVEAAELRSGPLHHASREVLVLSTPIPDPDGGSTRIGRLLGLLAWQSIVDELETVRRDLASQEIDPTVLLMDGPHSIAQAGSSVSPEAVPDLSRGYRIDEGAGVISGAAALPSGPGSWRLVVVERLEHALAPARALTRRLTGTTAIALAAALAVATLAARRVVGPLTELTGAIRAMAAGNQDEARVPVRSDDEVGLLARSFNQMTRELNETQRHLVEAEKFAFVGELASGVAHEVRTSLGVLRSAAQMLERSVAREDDGPDPELIAMIREEVGRLGGVVDELLTLDRPRALHLEPGRLSRPLERAAEFVEPRAREAGVTLEVDTAEDATVLCDREALQHLCVNLLVNAVEAVGRGGRVWLRTGPCSGDRACFRVEDDGPGIPEEMRERIFQPFVTARDAGVGLGLTFVKRAVHAHAGRITVREGSHGGACFEIQLPRHHPDPEDHP